MRTTNRALRRQEQEQERGVLAFLSDMARQEAHRVGGAARHAIDASDMATETWLRMAEHDAATLATLTAGGGRIDDAAMADAARRARMVTRSVVATTARSMTTEAPGIDMAPPTSAGSTAPCPCCQEADAARLLCDAARMADRRALRGTERWHAIHGAAMADGPAERADRDAGRGYAARHGGRMATLASVAERGAVAWPDTDGARNGGDTDGAAKGRKRGARTMGKRIAERTHGGPAHDAKGTVRLLREAPLSSLLSDAMRVHSDRSIAHDTEAERLWRGAWMATAGDALRARNVGGRRGSARAALAMALRRAEDDGAWRRRHGAALTYRADSLSRGAAIRENYAARLTAGATDTGLLTADGAPRSATAGEKRAARTAALRATEAAHDAAMALAVWQTATDGGRRPLRLLAALLASVDVAQHDASDRRSVASVVEWRLLALAIGADAGKRGTEALREFVRDAIGAMVVTDGGRQRAALTAERGAVLVWRGQEAERTAERIAALADAIGRSMAERQRAQRAEHADAIASAVATFRHQEAHRAARHAARSANPAS